MDRNFLFGCLKIGLTAWRAIFMFALPVVAYVYLLSAQKPAGPEQAEVAAPPEIVLAAPASPDLPRARPDRPTLADPIVTGSIARREPPAAAVAPRPRLASLLPSLPETGPGLPPSSRARLADAAAIAACEDKVREGLPLPNELMRLAASTQVYRAPGDSAVVLFAFDTFNGLRFPLSMQVQCVFDGDRLARLEVSSR